MSKRLSLPVEPCKQEYTIELGDLVTATVTDRSVEDIAHRAIQREFDPDYGKRLEKMLSALAEQMQKAAFFPGSAAPFVDTLTQHRMLAREYAETQEKKR